MSTPQIADELRPLLDAAYEDELSDEQWAALEPELLKNPDAQQALVDDVWLRMELRAWARGETSRDGALAGIRRSLGGTGAPGLTPSQGRAPMVAARSGASASSGDGGPVAALGSHGVPPAGALQGVQPLQGAAPAPGRPAHPLAFVIDPLAAVGRSALLGYALVSLLFVGAILGAMAIEPLAIRSVAVGSAREARSPGPPPTWRGRVTKEVGCRWADPATGRKNAARGKIELTDGMFEITLDSGVTITTLGGPVAYEVLSPDAILVARGLVIVLTPPVSGRVVTCFGLHGEPFLAAAVSTPARGGDSRQGSSPRGAGSPFHVLTPALSFADRGGVALCIKVESAVTTIAHCYDGRVDFQALRDGRAPRPTLHLDSRGWVFVDGRPNGEQVVVVGTDGAVPPSLAKRLPKMVFPAYSQQKRPMGPGQKPGPGA